MLLQALHKPVTPPSSTSTLGSQPLVQGGQCSQTASWHQPGPRRPNAPAPTHTSSPCFSATPLLPIMLWPKSLHHCLTLLRSPRRLCESKQIKTGKTINLPAAKREWDYPLSCIRAFRTPVNSFSASSEMDVISINSSISLLQVYNPGPSFSRAWEPSPGVWSSRNRLPFCPQILRGTGPWL